MQCPHLDACCSPRTARGRVKKPTPSCRHGWRSTLCATGVAHAIDGVEAGLLHDAWMGYPKEWIPRSRGANDEQITAALTALERRGWATDGVVNTAGVEFRQWLEEETNRLCARCWETFGIGNTETFLALIEPVGQRFVEHIDATAGPNWMPAARPRRV